MTHEHPDALPREAQLVLLRLARDTITAAAHGHPPPQVALDCLPPALCQPGACFVTISWKRTGELRGCTGVLRPELSLVEEVIRSAARTALSDPRFTPVCPDELDLLDIEISVLTPPQALEFTDPASLPGLLRPGIDGVTLSYRDQCRATFLPQVWEKIPEPDAFLGRLCLKMGLPRDLWRQPGMAVEVYQVQDFFESERAGG